MKPRVWFDAEIKQTHDWNGVPLRTPLVLEHLSGWGKNIAVDFHKETVRFSIQRFPGSPRRGGHTGYMIYNLSWWHPAVRIEWEAEPSDLIIHQGKKDDEKETTVKFWVHSSQGKQTEIHINLLPFQRKDGKYLREVLFQWVNSLGQWADPTKYDVEVGYEVFLGAVRSFIL